METYRGVMNDLYVVVDLVVGQIVEKMSTIPYTIR